MMLKNTILLMFVISCVSSCNPNKKNTSKLEIMDNHNKIILEDNNVQVDDSNQEFTLIRLSQKQSLNLKSITSANVGQEIQLKIDGLIIGRLKILSSIDSGLIRLEKNLNNRKIYDNPEDGAKGLWPESQGIK